MKCFAVVFSFLFSLAINQRIWCQAKLQTIVPKQAVTVGNAFQVQYIIQDLNNFQELQTPDFGSDFQLVSGPSIYQGTILNHGVSIPIQNYTYTLVPLRKGKLMVQGAKAVYNHGQQEAPLAFVTSMAETPPSKSANQYVVHVPLFAQSPEADLEKNIRQYLFVTTTANKKECYVGEPVVATFTLFSKLLSASDVIKNPGFYGFSVVDMPQADNQPETIENIKGSAYNKHLLRQVQLYPMQEGKLLIDEMTVHNAVELKDSITGGQREKELVLTTTPLAVVVKPLPMQGRPDHFYGAVGQFALKAQLVKDKIAIGEAGKLQLTLTGKGNFLQLNAPDIHWPQRVEGFEAVVTEQLDKDKVPVAGSRQYQYDFTVDSLGNYAIAPVTFSFFNPVSKAYQTLSTDTLHFTVIPKNRLQAFISSRRMAKGTANYNWVIFAGVLLTAGLLWWMMKQRKTSKNAGVDENIPGTSEDYEEQLKEINATGPVGIESYRQLQQIVYGFLKEKYGIQTSSKVHIQEQLTTVPINVQLKEDLRLILNECEVVQYYGATPSIPFTTLQQKAIAVVKSTDQLL